MSIIVCSAKTILSIMSDGLEMIKGSGEPEVSIAWRMWRTIRLVVMEWNPQNNLVKGNSHWSSSILAELNTRTPTACRSSLGQPGCQVRGVFCCSTSWVWSHRDGGHQANDKPSHCCTCIDNREQKSSHQSNLITKKKNILKDGCRSLVEYRLMG